MHTIASGVLYITMLTMVDTKGMIVGIVQQKKQNKKKKPQLEIVCLNTCRIICDNVMVYTITGTIIHLSKK